MKLDTQQPTMGMFFQGSGGRQIRGFVISLYKGGFSSQITVQGWQFLRIRGGEYRLW